MKTMEDTLTVAVPRAADYKDDDTCNNQPTRWIRQHRAADELSACGGCVCLRHKAEGQRREHDGHGVGDEGRTTRTSSR